MRASDAWKGGATGIKVRRGARRVPRSHARGKKNVRRRRIDVRTPKRREKNISARAKKRRGREKNIGAGEKNGAGPKKGAGAKKCSGANENTTHKKIIMTVW